MKLRRFILAMLMVFGIIAVSLPLSPAEIAQALYIRNTEGAHSYFMFGNTWASRWQHETRSGGDTTYCLTPSAANPDHDYKVSHTPSSALQRLLAAGYPARSTYGSLSQDEWQAATQVALWCATGKRSRKELRTNPNNPELIRAVDYLIAKYEDPDSMVLFNFTKPDRNYQTPHSSGLTGALANYYRSGPYTMRCDGGAETYAVALVAAPTGCYVGNTFGTRDSSFKSGERFFVYLPKAPNGSTNFTLDVSASILDTDFTCWKTTRANYQDMVVAKSQRTTKKTRLTIEWGRIKIIKKSDDGMNLSQTFKVEGNEKSWNATTNEDGIYFSNPIESGIYTVTETSAPSNYEQPESVKKTIACGTVATFTIRNITAKHGGGLRIIKTSEDEKDLSQTFRVDGPEGYFKVVTTAEDGTWFDPDAPEGTYTINETNVPSRYETPEEKNTVVSRDSVATVHFTNALKRGSLRLVKRSWVKGDDTEFTFLVEGKSSGYSGEWTVTAGAATVIDNLLPDTYTVTEINLDKTIYVQPESQKAIIDFENWATPQELIFENKEATPDILIVKTAEDKASVSGQRFQVESIDTGWSTIAKIPEGTNRVDVEVPAKGRYRVTEIDIPFRYTHPEPQELDASTGGTYTVEIDNKLGRGTVVVTKRDKDSPNSPVANTEYTLFRKTGVNLDGSPIWNLWGTALTDEEGKAQFSGDLLYGDYQLIESNPARNWLADSTSIKPRYFTVSWNTDCVEEHYYNEKVAVGCTVELATIGRTQQEDEFRYDISNIQNTSNCSADRFMMTDAIDVSHVELRHLMTGTFAGDDDGSMDVYFKTNRRDWTLWRKDVMTNTTTHLKIDTLNLEDGETITEYRYDFGGVGQNFKSTSSVSYFVKANSSIITESMIAGHVEVTVQREDMTASDAADVTTRGFETFTVKPKTETLAIPKPPVQKKAAVAKTFPTSLPHTGDFGTKRMLLSLVIGMAGLAFLLGGAFLALRTRRQIRTQGEHSISRSAHLRGQ